MLYLHIAVLFLFVMFIFLKQKTAYEMRIRDWSSDVCSSDLTTFALAVVVGRILSGYLCDRMGMRTMWMVIVGVEICAIALLTQSPGLARLHVGLSLVGLGSGALAPLQATLFARIFGPAFVGRVLGLAMPFFAVVPISALLAAWARQATGSYEVVFYVAIVAVGATVPFILLLKSEPNERLGPTASAIS